mmetsp:Transcript_17404/g.21990  ORF Transcript_17404/g.21990 Transcript_17404/m.21990 type:complete len:219 (+) Transcript_17404:607-1263(+)
MLLQDLHHAVCVSQVPQLLQIVVPVVAEEDVSLGQVVSVWVGLEGGLHPVDHLPGHVFSFKVLEKGVHAVERDDHRVVAELVDVVTALHPRLLDGAVGHDFGIRCDLLEHELPQIAVVFSFEILGRRLVVEDNVVVAENRQDGHGWKICLDRADRRLYRELHQVPVVLLRVDLDSHAVLAEISHQQYGLDRLAGLRLFICGLRKHLVQRNHAQRRTRL